MEPYDEREPAPVHILWGRVIVLGGALVLAFVLGMALGGDGAPTEDEIRASETFQDLADERDSLQTQNEQLQQQLDQLSRGDTPTDAPTVDADEDQPSGDGPSDGGGDARVYVVRQGDTLSGIAQRFYGNGGLEARERIARANDIEPDATLQVGDELTIPPADG